MATTIITFNIEQYRDFEIHTSNSYYLVYVKGSRKLIWEALDNREAKKWIDDLINWMYTNC